MCIYTYIYIYIYIYTHITIINILNIHTYINISLSLSPGQQAPGARGRTAASVLQVNYLPIPILVVVSGRHVHVSIHSKFQSIGENKININRSNTLNINKNKIRNKQINWIFPELKKRASTSYSSLSSESSKQNDTYRHFHIHISNITFHIPNSKSFRN